MDIIGPDGFFVYLFIVHGLLRLVWSCIVWVKELKPADLESQYVTVT